MYLFRLSVYLSIINQTSRNLFIFETAIKKRFCKEINCGNKIYIFFKCPLLILKCRTWLCIFLTHLSILVLHWWLWCQCLHIFPQLFCKFFKSKNKTSVLCISFCPTQCLYSMWSMTIGQLIIESLIFHLSYFYGLSILQ